MNLIAIQVVGEGSFALPPFFKPLSIKPIQWKFYGGSCSCVFQREIRFWGNKLEECQRLCKRTTAFWATVPNHLGGLEDFKENLQLLLGNEFTMTEIKAFQDQNGKLVSYGGRVKGDGVQEGDQGKLIEKLYRITFQEISHMSTEDDKSPTQPLQPPPYTALGETKPTLDNLNASIQKRIVGAAKERYWQLIFNHVKKYVADNFEDVGDKLLRIAAKLLKSNPSPDQLPFWEEVFAYIMDRDGRLPIIEHLAERRPVATKMIHWVQIIKHVKVNQVQFVVNLAASDPSANELEYWVEIVKCIKDNQLSIVDKLALLKLDVIRLKNWVEIFKLVEDNQLPIVGQLAVLNPYAGDLEKWRAVNNCGGNLA